MRTYRELVKAEYDFQIKYHWLSPKRLISTYLDEMAEVINHILVGFLGLIIGILYPFVMPFVYLYRFWLKPLILPLYKRKKMEEALDREEERKKKINEYLDKGKK